MVDVVINADDFGLSDGVCRSILELFDAGAITSTSLMTAAQGAPARMRRFGVSTLRGRAGVHLQLTGGRPLLRASEIPTLVDPTTGQFKDPRNSQHLPHPRDVEAEWRRQIGEAVELLGGLPTHLDSHHGMHRREGLFEIYVMLAAELKVPVRGASGELGRRMRLQGIAGSVAIVREWSGQSLGTGDLKRQLDDTIARYPSERAIEIVVHPGYCDEYLKSVSSLAAAREHEHQALLELAREGWPMSAGHTQQPYSIFARSQ